jgi:hypothetical protein
MRLSESAEWTDDDCLAQDGARDASIVQADNTHFSGAVSSQLKQLPFKSMWNWLRLDKLRTSAIKRTMTQNIPYRGDHLCLIHHRRLETFAFCVGRV